MVTRLSSRAHVRFAGSAKLLAYPCCCKALSSEPKLSLFLASQPRGPLQFVPGLSSTRAGRSLDRKIDDNHDDRTERDDEGEVGSKGEKVRDDVLRLTPPIRLVHRASDTKHCRAKQRTKKYQSRPSNCLRFFIHSRHHSIIRTHRDSKSRGQTQMKSPINTTW
jgi:hypothetical protein